MPNPNADQIEEMITSGVATSSRTELDRYLDNSFEWSFDSKKHGKSAKQYKKDKVKNEKIKERKDISQLSIDLIDEIDKMKCKEAQKKHLKIKLKQHLLWFKEFGLKI